MTRVLITGSTGCIGTVLTRRLPYAITGLDLPDHDISDYKLLVDQCAGQDAVVHLAGNFTSENWQSGTIEPQNFQLDLNVLRAAAETDVRRVVLASSVHADDFPAHSGTALLTVDRPHPIPTSPYGAHKLFLEGLGRHFAAHEGVEVVAIRFGGVTPEDWSSEEGWSSAVYLSHADLLACVRAAVEAPLPASGFAAFYAVSDNGGRVHDTANPLGWRPLRRTGRSDLADVETQA
jgi:nucleoside-diphosphate-sugar epimerase